MNNKITLISTGIFTLFFFISGLLEILDQYVVRVILFVVFLGIIVNIILVKTKGEDKKNLPK
jgi:hypothetical protein